jgi:hypothetical protein
MIDPTKTDLGAVGVLATADFRTVSSASSLSFKRFTAGSLSKTLLVEGACTGFVFTASWLKIQLGSRQLVSQGHGTFPKFLKAGTEGHMAVYVGRRTLPLSEKAVRFGITVTV